MSSPATVVEAHSHSRHIEHTKLASNIFFVLLSPQGADPLDLQGPSSSLFQSSFAINPSPSPRHDNGPRPPTLQQLLMPTRQRSLSSLSGAPGQLIPPPNPVHRRGRAKPFCPVRMQQGMWTLQNSRTHGAEGSSTDLPYPGKPTTLNPKP